MRSLLLLVTLVAQLIGGLMFDPIKAAQATVFFESVLKHTKGQFAGQPFVLFPWERKIIQDVYGTVKEDGTRQYKYVYIELPKKNGKSELGAGFALKQLFADGEKSAEVYSCAADRAQASIVFDVARDMVDYSPALQKLAKTTDSTKRIRDKRNGGVYRVVSAESYNKHGLNISAVIFDELHAQPNRKLWDVMTFGAGDARTQPLWVIITTAGEDPDRVSIGWEIHEYATKVAAGEIIDPTWYVAIFAYEGDDIYNEENWYQANPSLGHTISIESMREAAARAKLKPEDERLFRWLRLNQWVTSKLTTWQPIELFDQTVGDWKPVDLIGRDCYVGTDLSTTTDLSATAYIFPPQGDQLDWRVFWHTWIPQENMQERMERDHVPYDKWLGDGSLIATPGNVIDYIAIKEDILKMRHVFNIKEVAADPAFATMLLQELMGEGVNVVTIPQTFVNMTDPMNKVEVLMKSKELTHLASPVVRWAFGNLSIAKNGSGLIKPVKETKGRSVIRTKRIDPMVALFTGMNRAMTYKGSVDLSSVFTSPEGGF